MARPPSHGPRGDPPVIGIAVGRVPVAGGRVVDGTQREYADRITAAGGLPLLVPVQPAASVRSLADRLDGIVLAGGGDVEPGCYGAAPSAEVGGVDPDRDANEIALLEAASDCGIPVLAICRGLQILNVSRGGTLVQHLPAVTTLPHLVIERRTEPVHGVRVAPGSRLARITGTEQLATNSLHHQAVEVVGDGLDAVAWADDGTIEAIEDGGEPVIAVQWHPEQMTGRPEQAALFSWLVATSADRSAARPDGLTA